MLLSFGWKLSVLTLVQSALARRKSRVIGDHTTSNGRSTTVSASHRRMLVNAMIHSLSVFRIWKSIRLAGNRLIRIVDVALRIVTNWGSLARTERSVLARTRRERRSRQIRRRSRITKPRIDVTFAMQAEREGSLRLVGTAGVWRVVAINVKAVQPLIHLAAQTATTRLLSGIFLALSRRIMILVDGRKTQVRLRSEPWRELSTGRAGRV